MKNKLALFISGLILLLLLVGCGQKKETGVVSKKGFPVTIKDFSGQEITIKSKPEKIISTTPSNTEILFALGLDEEIVGVTNWCNYPAEAKEKEKIGDLKSVDIEKIVAIKPDLIVANASLNAQAIKAMRDFGLTVFVVEPQSINEVFDTIGVLAKATGTEAKGQEIIQGMKSTLNLVDNKLAVLNEKDKLKVFIEVGYDPLFTAGKGSFVHDIVTLAGGINIAADVDSYKQYSFEQLLAKNPQAIIISYSNYLIENQKIKNRPQWAKIDAVQKGRVIDDLDVNLLTRPGPRSAEAVKAIAERLYPELFN